MSHEHNSQCKCISTVAAQSLDEMEFERGIWSAALYNDIDKLRKFINAGQVNRIDSVGYSPLHYAARNGHFNVCDLLLNTGAEVNVCTRSGNVTPLMRAAMMGHENVVKLLISKGACICHQDVDGNTALHKAAQNKHHNTISVLLEATSDSNQLKNIRNRRDETADELLRKD